MQDGIVNKDRAVFLLARKGDRIYTDAKAKTLKRYIHANERYRMPVFFHLYIQKQSWSDIIYQAMGDWKRHSIRKFVAKSCFL